MSGGQSDLDRKVYHLISQTMSFHPEVEEQMELAASTIEKDEENEVKEEEENDAKVEEEN